MESEWLNKGDIGATQWTHVWEDSASHRDKICVMRSFGVNKMTITKTIFETSPINNTLSKGQARISGIIRKGIDEEKSLLVCMPETHYACFTCWD